MNLGTEILLILLGVGILARLDTMGKTLYAWYCLYANVTDREDEAEENIEFFMRSKWQRRRDKLKRGVR